MKLKKSRLEQIIKEELQLFSKTNGTFIIKESESIAGVLPTAEEKKIFELEDKNVDKDFQTAKADYSSSDEFLQALLSKLEKSSKGILSNVLQQMKKK
jgi:hypothetical protein